MSEELESNLVESPLLSRDAQKRWRAVGATFRVMRAFTLGREVAVESPGLELTRTPIDARRRLRVVCTALRIIRAFSIAGDAIVETQNELLDELLDNPPSDAVINIQPDCLSNLVENLVQTQSSEQLHQLGGVEGVASVLGTDTENGICGNEETIDHRRQSSGANRIQKPPSDILQIVLETIRDPIIIILLLCAALSLGFGIIKHGRKGWSDGGSIFLAVFVVIAVTAYCKLWPRRQIFKLSRASDDFTIENTPLQVKLHDLAMLIAKVGFMVASLILVVLLIRYFTGNMRDDKGKPEFLAGKTRIHHVFKAIIGMLATPIAIASTAIPEGLLLAVTIPIAYSTVSISTLVIDSVTAISAREPPTIKMVAAISAGEVPFAAVQVLWVKLIVGTLAALAITIEEPVEELQQLPYFKAESLFKLDAKVKETMIFNILVLWQLFTIFTG